ncbi:MAG: MCP four helix bundle domain-containing protein [Phaeodactylibacter sp.]|nr:MCP four helix bundle domain-containing protein [Phaeodactylibacter sp.]MCB9049164.1 MCP four helix bundle domain-containing protein [Lewinellaceae bacterium]
MAKNNLFRKLRTAGSLVVVFLLIYTTNRLDKHHFDNVQHIMNSVYEDRIVAQHYIYQLNNLYHQKYEEILGSFKVGGLKDINRQIAEYIELFSATSLTTKEAQVFQSLLEKDEELQALEAHLAAMPDNGRRADGISQFKRKLEMVFKNLEDLSEIQLNEGGRLRKEAQDSLDRTSFLSKLELAVLIFIGIIVQVIIFYSPKRD